MKPLPKYIALICVAAVSLAGCATSPEAQLAAGPTAAGPIAPELTREAVLADLRHARDADLLKIPEKEAGMPEGFGY